MKNYVDLLNEEDIADLLRQGNLVLVNDIKKKVIKKTKQGIIVRCQKAKSISKAMRNMIKNGLPSHIYNILFGNESVDEEPEDDSEKILLIQNFVIYKIECDKTKQIEQTISGIYYDFMVDKFGEEYVCDYDNYKLIKKQKDLTL